MPTEHSIEGVLGASYQDFVTSVLPLFSGPFVRVRVGSGGHEYQLLKALLCSQSSYFAAKFGGEFQEGQYQSITLTEEEGVVTQRSFKLLVQWLYLGRVVFSEPSPTESITTAIEFVRLADMCDVKGMETLMAEHIKAVLLANPAPQNSYLVEDRDPDTDTYCLVGQHFTSAAFLPNDHPVRQILAAAAVEGYIRRDRHKFLKEIRESPGFAFDLLLAVKEALKTVRLGETNRTFKEPLGGKSVPFVTIAGRENPTHASVW